MRGVGHIFRRSERYNQSFGASQITYGEAARRDQQVLLLRAEQSGRAGMPQAVSGHVETPAI